MFSCKHLYLHISLFMTHRQSRCVSPITVNFLTPTDIPICSRKFLNAGLVWVWSPLPEEARTPGATQARVWKINVEDSTQIQIYHIYPHHEYLQQAKLLRKQLIKESEWVIQEKVVFPEEKELMGRTEMGSPAPENESIFPVTRMSC